MQKADVLVTVHGADIVQIFPLGYHSLWFKPLIESVGARHFQLGSRADKGKFLNPGIVQTGAGKHLYFARYISEAGGCL